MVDVIGAPGETTDLLAVGDVHRTVRFSHCAATPGRRT